MSRKKDITLLDVINHMNLKFSDLESRLDRRLGGMEKRMGSMDKRMDTLEHTVKEGFRKTHDAFQHLYENRLKEVKRVNKIEKRVERIERKVIPALKSQIRFAR